SRLLSTALHRVTPDAADKRRGPTHEGDGQLRRQATFAFGERVNARLLRLQRYRTARWEEFSLARNYAASLARPGCGDRDSAKAPLGQAGRMTSSKPARIVVR